MRIIAGIAKGRTLTAPKGQNTRPTLDYVRESLFNIIQRDVPDAVVLDLFAGSGALALEALSRGAAKAVLVDSSRQAIECIRRNVETLRFSDQVSVNPSDWRMALQRLSPAENRFDLVFLDPPYRLSIYQEIAGLLEQRHLLAQDALIVTEHHRDIPVELGQAFQLRDYRTYGDTVIHMHTFHKGGQADEQ